MEEKIVVRYDAAAMKRMGLILLGLAVAVWGLGVGCYFWRPKDWMFLLVLGLIGVALLLMGVNYFMKSNNPVVFTIEDGVLHLHQLKGGQAPVEKVAQFGASLSFGRRRDAADQYGTLAEIAVSPPLPHRRGDLYLEVEGRLFKFAQVADIMETAQMLREVIPTYRVLLWAGQNKREYAYWDPDHAESDEQSSVESEHGEEPEGEPKEQSEEDDTIS